MVLIDFTGLIFQHTHSCVSISKPELNENNKYNSSDILPYLKTYLLNELFDIHNKHSNEKIIICVDNTYKRNWRKEYYKQYKVSRNTKDNPIPFNEIFKDLNILIKELSENTPFHVIDVEGAEADDCILTLSHVYSQYENVLIISSDKDMLQAQRDKNVKQYSPLLKKFITYKDKDVDNINEWIIEHVVLGDSADDVPRIFDNTEYTDEFITYLKSNNMSTDVRDFNDVCDKAISYNGEIFKKLRIGAKTIQKMIKNKTINEFIEKYHDNFIRNKTLILSEYIPEDIKNDIIQKYKKSISKQCTCKNIDNFVNYLYDTELQKVVENIPTEFRNSVVTIDDFI